MTRHKKRAQGATVAETAASMALMIPLLILILFVVVEVSQAYMIKEALSNASRQAARDLAVAYGQNPKIESEDYLQDSMVFDHIRIQGIVNDSNQFDDPVWNSSGAPPTVTVTVRYTGGQYGLPPFPNPDPLNLGKNFRLDATSTYRLE